MFVYKHAEIMRQKAVYSFFFLKKKKKENSTGK